MFKGMNVRESYSRGLEQGTLATETLELISHHLENDATLTDVVQACYYPSLIRSCLFVE